MTHDRCSELLGDYAAGRLDAPETAAVEAHLAGCPDCSTELRAVMALRVADEPLSEMERARLHKGVRDRLRGDVISATAARGARRGARLAAALGAAALIAVGGVAVVSLSSGGDDDAPAEALMGEDAGEGGGAANDSTGTRAGSAPAFEAAAPQPRPSFDDDAGDLSGGKLDKLARKNAALTAFSNAYSAKDADRLKDDYVDELADQAGPPSQRALLKRCADEVYAAQPYAALPAYAGRGSLDGRPALVLGFAWTDEDAGPLDQFMFWTWPEESCDQPPIDYRAGPIDPRK